jgi:hypothetical protein
MGFALRASFWLFKFDPVKFVGSALQHKFIPDEFVFACPKKSNQKKRHPNQFAPSGPLSIRLCLRVVLTRRPGST